MSLGEPPATHLLHRLPSWRLSGRTLWRAHLARREPWWFCSAPGPSARETGDGGGGRFDLPSPDGTCYLATSPAAAILEALGDFSGGVLPVSALLSRSMMEARAPQGSPSMADVTAERAAGFGLGAPLWADGRRQLTQHWARRIRGAGWPGIHYGASHDPSGWSRCVALFDEHGAHPPWGAPWATTVSPLLAPETLRSLSRFGVTVTARTPNLEVVPD